MSYTYKFAKIMVCCFIIAIGLLGYNHYTGGKLAKAQQLYSAKIYENGKYIMHIDNVYSWYVNSKDGRIIELSTIDRGKVYITTGIVVIKPK
jgi:hypothetical protein